MIHILTFDIEEWFHVFEFDKKETPLHKIKYGERLKRNLNSLLFFLDWYDQKATFFVSGWVARHYPELVRKILKNGHEVGLRAQGYCKYEKYSEKSFREYIHRNISEIQDVSGKIIRYYRSSNPLNSETKNWVIPVLAEKGFEVDSSVVPVQCGTEGQFFYDQPCWIKSEGIILREMPANTFGFQKLKYGLTEQGHRKLLPYWFIWSSSKYSDYLLTYFHSRDFEAIKTEEALFSSIKLCYLKARKYKLDSFREWVGNQDFINLSQAIDKVEWENASIISLD